MQPLIEVLQLGPDIISRLAPSTIGVNGTVLTSDGTNILWLPSTTGTLAALSDVAISSPANGQVLTYNGSVWTNQAITGTGTVTSVAIGGSTGLSVSGSPITTNGTITLTLGTELQGLSNLLSNGFVQRTGAGTYTAAALASSDVTTALGFIPYNATNPNGYITNATTITLNGPDVTGTGTIAAGISATLPTTGVTAGTYNTVTVTAKGLVTGGTNQSFLTSNQTITLSGAVTGSGTTAITTTLGNSGVAAGTYGSATAIPSFTVGSDGRLTATSTYSLTRPIFTSSTQGEVPASGGGTANFLRADGTWSAPPITGGTVTSVAAITSGTGLTVTGSPITTNGTLTFTVNAELSALAGLSNIGFVQRTAPGTYNVTALSNAQIITALGYTPISNVTNLSTTAPLVGGGQLSTGLTLSMNPFNGSNSGYVAKNSTVTGSAFLRDDGVWVTPSGAGSVTSVGADGGTTGMTFSNSPITTSGSLSLGGTLGIANGGTGQTTANAALNALLPSQSSSAGYYLSTNGTTSSWAAVAAGGVTSFNTRSGAITLTSGDVTTALGYTPYNSTNPNGYTANTGTVTSVSVTSANGISGSVTTATTTPAITLALGAITPTSVSTGTLTLSGTTNAVLTSSPTSYGSIAVSSSSGGWAGVQFTGSYHNQTFMVSTSQDWTGVYDPTSSAWQWYITGGAFNGVTQFNGNASTATTATSATTATTAAQANTLDLVGAGYATFNWSGQSGQPSWLIGGNTGTTFYVYNPSNFAVASATTATNASAVTNNSARTDGTAYPVLWSPAGGGAAEATYSCSAVTITSSTGTLTATTVIGTSNVQSNSDARLKQDVVAIPNALDKVKALVGVNFNWKKDGTAGTGLIAQNVQEVMPAAVGENDGTLSVAYGNLVGLLIEAIKELSTKVEELEKK